jgi:hypothetical protein
MCLLVCKVEEKVKSRCLQRMFSSKASIDSDVMCHLDSLCNKSPDPIGGSCSQYTYVLQEQRECKLQGRLPSIVVRHGHRHFKKCKTGLLIYVFKAAKCERCKEKSKLRTKICYIDVDIA